MSEILPKVSIITISYNAAHGIRNTIESVLQQTYHNIEYIIIDGGSTDGTVEIIREYDSKITKWISEPDRGISDAFNKGINFAGGEFIQFINAGDILAPDKIEKSVKLITAHPDCGFVFGDLYLSTQRGTEIVRGNEQYSRTLSYVMDGINHPTVLVRKSLFDRYGLFDVRWKIAMDYDWHLRIHKLGIVGKYSPDIIVYIPSWGMSSVERYTAFKECRDISIQHGLNPLFAYFYYILRCLKHFLLQVLGKR